MARLKQTLEKYQIALMFLAMGFIFFVYTLLADSFTWWRYVFAGSFIFAGLYHGWQQFHLVNTKPTSEKTRKRIATNPIAKLQKTGRHGFVTEKLGDAFYGNSQVYTDDLYYGRASQGAKLYLIDNRVFQSVHNLPIIKVRIMAGGADGLDSDIMNKVGWLSLTATSFADFYDPDTKTIHVYGPNQTDEEAVTKARHNQPEDLSLVMNTLRTVVGDYDTALANVINQGTSAFEALIELSQDEDTTLAEIAKKLIRDIGQQSLDNHQPVRDRLICPKCYTHFTLQTLKVSNRETIDFCACRHCRQSQHGLMLASKGQVIALLDGRSKREFREQGNDLLINWSVYRQLFDFDAVKITWATDEEVERFIVQISNKVEPNQRNRNRYQKMYCRIAERCQLSENTYRILRHTFAQVEVG